MEVHNKYNSVQAKRKRMSRDFLFLVGILWSAKS